MGLVSFPWRSVGKIRLFCSGPQCIVSFWPHHEACRILVPQPEIESGSPAMEPQSPNHWASREVPPSVFIAVRLVVCICRPVSTPLLVGLGALSSLEPPCEWCVNSLSSKASWCKCTRLSPGYHPQSGTNGVQGMYILNMLSSNETVTYLSSRSVVSDSTRPHGLEPTRLLRSWDFAGKSTGVGCHFLLQGIFLPQGSNWGLPKGRQMLYHLSHQGSTLMRW